METKLYERDRAAQTKPIIRSNLLRQKKKKVVANSKGKFDIQPTRNHDIKCLRCFGVGHITSQ